MEVGEAAGSPELSYRGLEGPCYRCWETKLGPLQEQEVLVPLRHLFSPQNCSLKKVKIKNSLGLTAYDYTWEEETRGTQF